MKLTVNGEMRDCAVTNLAELWRSETLDLEIAEPRGFAISLNGAVVRRTATRQDADEGAFRITVSFWVMRLSQSTWSACGTPGDAR